MLVFFAILTALQGTPEQDTLRTRLEKLFETASKWGVGENKEKVKKAREELASLGKEALDYIFEEKIKTLKTTELRAILAVIKKNKKEATSYLVNALKGENDTIRRAALWLCAKSKDTAAVPTILEILQTDTMPRMKARALYALGEIGDTTAVKEVIKYLESDNEMVRMRSASALANMATSILNNLYLKMLSSHEFQVRYQGVHGLAKNGKSGIDWILNQIEKTLDLKIQRLLIKSLIEILDKDTVDKITSAKIRNTLFIFLDSEDPVLRTYTVDALARVGGESVINRLKEKIETETHPLVRWRINQFLKQYQ